MIKLIFSIVLFSLNIYSSQIIYTSEFIDVERKIVVKDSSIIIDNGIVSSIEKGFIKVDKDYSVIDLRGYSVMPGLMDMHVHFGQEYKSKAERPIKIERETEAILALQNCMSSYKFSLQTL